MRCYLHDDLEPVGVCTNCGKPICADCALDVQGSLLCKACATAQFISLSPNHLGQSPASSGAPPAKQDSNLKIGNEGKESSGWIHIGIVFGTIAVVLTLFLIFGNREKSDQSSQVSQPASASGPTLEYKLASINAGGYVRQDDITITRFRYLLTSIASKTVNTQQEIADMSVYAWNVLRDRYGKNFKLLEVMEAANTAIPTGQKMKYAEVIAALIILLKD